ncbi:MAG: hypothetical protein EXS01_07195, partial [Phycisphaerales bacterium]|nr:hypothetical protein [Phycisphaerales bacterium]
MKVMEGSALERRGHHPRLTDGAPPRAAPQPGLDGYPLPLMAAWIAWSISQIRITTVCVFACTACCLALAATAPAFCGATSNLDDEALADRPISEVVISGLNRVTEQEVRNNLRIATGQPYEAKAVKDDIATLYRLGHFDAVTVDATLLADGTVRIRYIVIEQPIIRDIQVVGNKVVSDQELRAAIALYPGGARDDFLLDRSVEKIKKLYRTRGNYMIEVTVDETRLTETGILIFRIVEGPQVRIKEIVFSGNDRFDTNQLGAQIKTKPWVFIFSTGNLDEEQLIDDVAALVKFYTDRGFIDVRLDKRVEISASGKEAKVVFVISEGRQYRLRSVSVQSADANSGSQPRVLQAEQVLGLMVIRPGDYYTQDKVEQSIKAVREAYQTMGYIEALVQPERV